MKANTLRLSVTIICAVVVTGCASTQDIQAPITSKPAANATAEEGFAIFAGEIVSLTANELEIQVLQRTLALKVTDKTTYRDKDGNVISSGSFKTGDYVRVTTTGINSMTAFTIMRAE